MPAVALSCINPISLWWSSKSEPPSAVTAKSFGFCCTAAGAACPALSELTAGWRDKQRPTYIVKSIFINFTKDSDNVPCAERKFSLQKNICFVRQTLMVFFLTASPFNIFLLFCIKTVSETEVNCESSHWAFLECEIEAPLLAGCRQLQDSLCQTSWMQPHPGGTENISAQNWAMQPNGSQCCAE